jgi:hypothetical protein
MNEGTTGRCNFRSAGAALALAMVFTTGCKSKEEQAVETAKKQAAATGQAQQVVTVDKSGNTTTVTIQPPAPGQSAEVITTTVTPAQPKPAVPEPGVPVIRPAAAASSAEQHTLPYPGQPNAAQPNATQQGQSNTEQPGAPGAVQPADVDIPAGTTLAIRINQHISVKTTPAGSRFDGEIAEPYADASGRIVLPRGTPVGGIVDESHRRGRFKGASILELRLTSLTLNGTRYPLDTRDVMRSKKGKGRRTAAFIGGGSGLGMLIGGLASGGTGLLVGGLAGAGAGTAAAGFTGNRDLDIPSESLLRFRLADDLTLQSQ